MSDLVPFHSFDLRRAEPDWVLLGRFFRGDCSPGEVESIAAWESAAPDNAKVIAFMRRVWDEAGVGPLEVDEDSGWRAMRARLTEDAPPTPWRTVRPLRLIPPVRPRRRTWLRGLAAAVVVALAGGALVWQAGRAGRVDSEHDREYVTAPGERAELQLADGTRVWLAAASRLRVPAAYGTRARDVALDGEAYFIVQHETARPFRVHTANGIAEDIGTAFVVTAYRQTGTMRTVVTSGAVMLRRRNVADTTGVTLREGDLGDLDPSGTITLRRNIDVAPYLGWLEGRLVFDEVPLPDALTAIGRWYDVRIEVADAALAQRSFTATFENEPLARVLRVLEVALGARAEQTGRLVVLRPRDQTSSAHR